MKIFVRLFLAAVFILGAFYFTRPADYSEKVLELDRKLQDFISCFGIKEDSLASSFKQTSTEGRHTYLYLGKIYTVTEDFPQANFEKKFYRFLEKKNFDVKKESYGTQEQHLRYDIFLGEQKVYTLLLEQQPPNELALVIDDWGYNLHLVDYLEKISIPLNISILPGLKYSRQINDIAPQKGHEVLLHLPMQPLPSKNIMEKHLEKNTIKIDMDGEKIQTLLTEFIKELDNMKGANNHMGSLISRDEEIMQIILDRLQETDLYYLDSKVVADSVASSVAKKTATAFFERDVFLDTENDPEHIKNQIRKAIKISQEKGYAVAIGHARETTLKAIKTMLPEIKQNARPIRLSELK